MRQRYFKKCTAFMLVVTMIMGCSMSASAESLGQGSGTGVGEVEGSVKTDIYQVILPANTDGVFDFILDPQGLINKTDAAAYDGKKFEAGSTVFFERKDGESEEDYCNTSDFVTITNKSSIAVNVSLHVSIDLSSVEGITMTDDKEFTEDTGTSLYLAILDGEDEIPISEDGLKMDITIDAAPEGAYEYVYDESRDEYNFRLSDDLGGVEFPKYSFQLTGAANGKGDWSELTGAKPEVTVAWEITPSEG